MDDKNGVNPDTRKYIDSSEVQVILENYSYGHENRSCCGRGQTLFNVIVIIIISIILILLIIKLFWKICFVVDL